MEAGPYIFLLIATICQLAFARRVIEIGMPDVSPKEKESYLCTHKKLPIQTSYAVEFVPHADKETAHHILLFACKHPAFHRRYWECTSNEICKGGEETVLYAWAKNAPGLKLPGNVGFKLGKAVNLRYLVMQVHYARPLDVDEVDGSSISLHLTQRRPKFKAGIYEFIGDNFQIPPKSIGYNVDMLCSYQGSPIMPFAFRTHAHDRGRSISAYRIRDGTWSQIGIGSPQRPQAFYTIPKKQRLVIKKGDRMAARCTYDSPDATKPISTGSYSTDEMCNFYMMYYTTNKFSSNVGDICDRDAKNVKFPKGSYLPNPLPGSIVTQQTKTVKSVISLVSTHAPDVASTKSTRAPDVASTKAVTEAVVQKSQPYLDDTWSIGDHARQSIGQVSGLSIDKNKHIVVLHLADRIWNSDTFDEENFYTGPMEPIGSNTMLHVHQSTGKVIRALGKHHFYLPYGLTVDFEGNYWVTDLALHQVMKFSASNLQRLSLTLGVKLIPGNDVKHFCKPTDVAVDLKGNIFVADGFCNDRIVKFDANGTLLKEWGSNNEGTGNSHGSLSNPHSIKLDHKLNHVYVSDMGDARILVFNTDGKFLKLIQHEQFGGSVYAIAFNNAYDGLLYALTQDVKNDHSIGHTINASSGAILNSWTGSNQLNGRPHDMVVIDDNKALFVSVSPKKVLKFSVSNPVAISGQQHAHVNAQFPWKEVQKTPNKTPSNKPTDEDIYYPGYNEKEDTVTMVPAIVVVIVLATPIVLVFVAAIIQHLRFKHKRTKAVKKMRRNLKEKKNSNLWFGCCYTPRYYYDSNRGFDKLVENHSSESSGEEEKLFSRKA